MPDLELTSTEDLVSELYARYDCVVFAGMRDLGATEQETDCGFAGGAVSARGLACALADYIREHQRVTAERHDLKDWEDEE